MMDRSSKMQGALIVCAAASFAVALWDLAFGGFHFQIASVRVSSWEAFKPFRVGAICTAAAVWLHDRGTPNTAAWTRSARWTVAPAAAASLVVVVLTIPFGSFVAGGSDAYGYVSQAYLWASGHLVSHEPFTRFATLVGPAVAPLGYVVGHSDALVPTYPPGLPLAMALATKVGGPRALYVVVPLLSGLAVWLTYVLGAQVGGRGIGMIASVLFAFSPIFLNQAFAPMSDVPATAWWLFAWVFALRPGVSSAFVAGIAASAAILTRPNLVPLAIVLALVVAIERSRGKRVISFAAGLVPACGIIAALNAYWYGSALRSGYGSPRELYAWSNGAANLRNYTAWLVELHSPGILIACLAPFMLRSKATAAMSAFIAVVLFSYLFYFVYDTWSFVRFLLPAIPLLFILLAAVMVTALERIPIAMRRACVVLLCLLAPCWFLIRAERLMVFDNRRAEYRQVAVGEFVKSRLPANAVVMTVSESGSVRLYGARPTLRWDVIEPSRFEQVVEVMRTHGYAAYILLESSEENQFRATFAESSVLGRLDWPALIQYYGPTDVRVWAVDDRMRYVGGHRWLPEVVPPE